MTSEQLLLEKIRLLPPNLKQEAADFIDFLQTKVDRPASEFGREFENGLTLEDARQQTIERVRTRWDK
jgi:hypothetical protein